MDVANFFYLIKYTYKININTRILNFFVYIFHHLPLLFPHSLQTLSSTCPIPLSPNSFITSNHCQSLHLLKPRPPPPLPTHPSNFHNIIPNDLFGGLSQMELYLLIPHISISLIIKITVFFFLGFGFLRLD